MKIIFMGDSTMQFNDETTWPQVGWPQALKGKFRDDVELLNFAKNGRSTKSFIELGNFENALKHVDENSIVIMEFGHNDEHDYDPERFTCPEFEYRDNLIYMVESCRKKGAYVMLLTPVFRRKFHDDGTIDWSCHAGYREAMIRVGKDTGTDVIDMTGLTAEMLQEMGFDNARELYMNFDAGIYPNYPEGMNDNTHLRMKGAEKIAGIFLKQIRNNKRFEGLLND